MDHLRTRSSLKSAWAERFAGVVATHRGDGKTAETTAVEHVARALAARHDRIERGRPRLIGGTGRIGLRVPATPRRLRQMALNTGISESQLAREAINDDYLARGPDAESDPADAGAPQ